MSRLDSFRTARVLFRNVEQAMSQLPDDSKERVCLSIVEPMMITEFGGRIDDPYFDELVSEAYLGATKALLSWNPQGGMSLESWTWRLAKNRVLNYLSKLLRARDYETGEQSGTLLIDDGFEDELEPPQHDDRGWFGERVGAGQRSMEWQAEYELMIRRLCDRDASILEMMLTGITQQEMGRVLGLSQSRVARLIGLLKTQLNVHENQELRPAQA